MSVERFDRRYFFGAAAASLAASGLGKMDLAGARSKPNPSAATATKGASEASFGPLKQIDAGLLNVTYAEAGPAGGAPVMLLHGWPYDIHSFVEVAPLLASKGYRVIVRTCAATGRRGFSRAIRSETANLPSLPSTPSP